MVMKLIRSRFAKIEAVRDIEFNGKVEINTNINISSIEKLNNSKEAIKAKYNFNIDYSGLGKISLEGIIFLSCDPKTVKELLKNQEKKEFNSEEFIAITNLIIQKASIKAFELEEELDLPIHTKLPSISPKK